MKNAKPYCWSELQRDQPIEKLQRRRIIGERVMLSEVFLHKGCQVGTHAHENEQFAMVMSGRIRFTIGGDARQEHVLKAGEVMHLPPNVPHAAEALEDTLVIDIFSPVSEATGIDRQ